MTQPAIRAASAAEAEQTAAAHNYKVSPFITRTAKAEGVACPWQLIGFASGAVPQIPANILLVKNVTACGLNFGTYYGWSPNDVRWEMEPRVRAIAEAFHGWADGGRIAPHVCATFPLDRFREAMALVLSRRSTGRVALTMEDIQTTHEGLIVTLRRSKTDQEGQTMVRGLPKGTSAATCPVRVLEQWTTAAKITTGPIFRSVNRYGTVGKKALSGLAVPRIVKESR